MDNKIEPDMIFAIVFLTIILFCLSIANGLFEGSEGQDARPECNSSVDEGIELDIMYH